MGEFAWKDIAQYGPHWLVIIGFLAWLYKGLWPWMTNKIDQKDREHLEAMNRIATALESVRLTSEASRIEILGEIRRIDR